MSKMRMHTFSLATLMAQSTISKSPLIPSARWLLALILVPLQP